MTDAFEIGVSLALQDGVSDAIGKARRDVAALEHAVRESGVSVRSLREAGTKASSVAFSDRRNAVADEPVKRVVQEALPAVVGPGAPVASSALLGATGAVTRDMDARERSMQVPDARAGDLVLPQAPGATPDNAAGRVKFHVEIPSTVTPRAAQPLFAQRMEPLAASAPHAEGGLARNATPLERAGSFAPLGGLAGRVEAGVAGPGAGMAPVALRASAEAPPSPLGMVSVAAPAAAPLLRQGTGAEEFSALPAALSTARAGTQGDAGYVSLLSALRLSGGSTDTAQNETHSVAQSDIAPAGTDALQSDNVQQELVFAARREGGAMPVGLAAAQGARASDVPQPADKRDAGPQEGDVFLDGMLVGRWISKFLNREAGRASAGPTGFDARRGQLLPGVTVGS
jgi:hypothetical protein